MLFPTLLTFSTLTTKTTWKYLNFSLEDRKAYTTLVDNFHLVVKMAIQIKNVWVKVSEPGLIQVQSFTNPEKWYVVDRLERSCTCECFKTRGWCKHLNFVLEYEDLIHLEEGVWKTNKKFEEWKRKTLLERLKGFKPLDEETRRAFREAGWEYDEGLSAMIHILLT